MVAGKANHGHLLSSGIVHVPPLSFRIQSHYPLQTTSTNTEGGVCLLRLLLLSFPSRPTNTQLQPDLALLLSSPEPRPSILEIRLSTHFGSTSKPEPHQDKPRFLSLHSHTLFALVRASQRRRFPTSFPASQLFDLPNQHQHSPSFHHPPTRPGPCLEAHRGTKNWQQTAASSRDCTWTLDAILAVTSRPASQFLQRNDFPVPCVLSWPSVSAARPGMAFGRRFVAKRRRSAHQLRPDI